MGANILFRAFVHQRFIVAFSATIFCLIGSAGYVRKKAFTHIAFCGNLYASRQRKAFTAAIKCAIFAIVRYRKICCAV